MKETNRRFLELKGLGIEADKEQVKQNLIERDKIDSEREIAPLKQADDAIVIDNSALTKEETIQLILSHIKRFNNFFNRLQASFGIQIVKFITVKLIYY